MSVKGKMHIIIDCNHNYEVIFADEMHGYIEKKPIPASWNTPLAPVPILLMTALVKLIFSITVKYFMNRL